MLELLLAFALITAGVRAFSMKQRLESVGAATALYVTLADTLNVAAAKFIDLHPLHVFVFMFLGPSMWHLRGEGVLPLPSLLHRPLAMRLFRLALSSALAWRCARESSRLNPLLPRSYALDRLAMPFVGAAVLDALEGVLLIAGTYLMGR